MAAVILDSAIPDERSSVADIERTIALGRNREMNEKDLAVLGRDPTVSLSSLEQRTIPDRRTPESSVSGCRG
jgi:hypothetical protein